MAKALVLLSGGLDSATTLGIAIDQGYQCYALSFDYGQRHLAEMQAAKQIAENMGVREHKIINLDLKQIGGSALTDSEISVPVELEDGIPITYVPARNTIFLSIALAWAEVLEIQNIFIGVNAVDYSGYPDCRSEYITAFESMANLATKAAVEGNKLVIHTPLITLTKAEIIKHGSDIGIEYAQTVSCYQANEQGQACGQCDSCRFRAAGFEVAGLPDPTPYY